MKLNLWSPLPPSSSGIADYVAEQLPFLARGAEICLVVEEPALVDAAIRGAYTVCAADEVGVGDLDLYHLGNSPAHGFVYRRARRVPGVVVLHDFSLHHLVLRETVERGDRSAYLREMRLAYGETGSFVGRQVARGLGGAMLPALFPLSEGMLRGALGVVGLTEYVTARARARMPPGRPTLRLPHHLSLPLERLPTRAEARRALGLPEDAQLITAPGFLTRAKQPEAALELLASLANEMPRLRLVVAGAVDPELPFAEWLARLSLDARVIQTGRLTLEDFVRHLCAADILLALRFPHHGEISGALVRGLGVGRPALVSAGSPVAEEFPDGVVVPVDPGPHQAEQLRALVVKLLHDAPLRAEMERVARDWLCEHHALGATVERLLAFLREVHAAGPAILAEIAKGRAQAGSLHALVQDELCFGAYDLGVAGFELGTEALLAGLLGPPT